MPHPRWRPAPSDSGGVANVAPRHVTFYVAVSLVVVPTGKMAAPRGCQLLVAGFSVVLWWARLACGSAEDGSFKCEELRLGQYPERRICVGEGDRWSV